MNRAKRPKAAREGAGARRSSGAPTRDAGTPRGAGAPPRGAAARAAAAPRASRTPPVPPRHPAFLLFLAVAALSVIVSVSFRLVDTDLWTHLAFGRALWTLHRVPATEILSWPHYGAPAVPAAWGFRALLWPLWNAGGVPALFAWRWATTLAAFALLWAAARAGGARGFVAPLVVTLCVLIYRTRTEIRPETLVAVLFAFELWVLETRRGGGPDRSAWLVPAACLWANVHLSYYLGLFLVGVYLLDALRHRRAADPAVAPLAWALGLAAAVSFLNPAGARGLAQPFAFAFLWRHEPLYRDITELRPLAWASHLRDGLPLVFAGWPLLALLRWRRRGLDLAELALCAFFSSVALMSQRFLGFYALAAAAFVARDLQEAVDALAWPAWSASPWARAALAAAACVALSLPEWMRPEIPLGVALESTSVPAAACDFMAAHGVRGRGFNPFHLGGYLGYRFWPDRTRLPFMGTQPENSPREDRALYARVFGDPDAWHTLDAQYRFDYALLDRTQTTNDRLLDMLDADSTWAMVFSDDAAEVLVRRDGPLASVARASGYRVLPPGREGRDRLLAACGADTALRARARAELEHAAAASRANGSAEQLLGILALMDGRVGDARVALERAVRRLPLQPRLHETLGQIALGQGRARDAIREFGLEARSGSRTPGHDYRLGQAWQLAGDTHAARAAYARELTYDPRNEAARDSLRQLEAASAR